MNTMYDLKQLLIDFPSQPSFVLGYDDPPTMERKYRYMGS